MPLKHLLSIIFFCGVLSISTSVFGDDEVASIYPQPDSPVKLSKVVPRFEKVTDNKGRDSSMLSLNYVLQNVSSKPIRAYTVRMFKGNFNEGCGDVDLAIIPTAQGLFKPNQILNQSTLSFGETDSDGNDVEQKGLKLAVDFVEFTDGTTWGLDLSGSAQNLAGLREGVKAAQEYLLNAKNQSGTESISKAFEEAGALAPPAGQTPNWNNGFKTGSRNLSQRVKNIYQKQGAKAAEDELHKSLFSPI